MRLEHIHLDNFGSYHRQGIDLREVSAAVICGPNGAGKSTGFVDAPLWALFGKCRTDTDAMLRLGEELMTVSLTFLLNGQRYKVVRTRSLKTKAGKSELQLYVGSATGSRDDVEWTPASGSRLADTQHKILELLNADYDLLTATGFLLQGQADRFSRATPAERKAILAQILRLDSYAGLRTLANREDAVLLSAWVEQSKRLTELEGTAGALATLRAEAAGLEGRLQTLRHSIAQAEHHLEEWTGTEARVQAKLDGLTSLQAELARVREKVHEHEANRSLLEGHRDRLAEILKNRTVIETKVEEQRLVNLKIDKGRTDEQWIAAELDRINQAVQDIQAELSKGAALERDIERATGIVADAVRRYREATARMKEEIERDERSCGLLAQVPCNADLQGQCQFTIQTVRLKDGLPERRQLLANRWGTDEAIAAEVASLEKEEADLKAIELNEWRSQNWADQLTAYQAEQTDFRKKRSAVQSEQARLTAELAELGKFTVLVPELQQADVDQARVTKDLEALTLLEAETSSGIQKLTQDLAERPALESDLQQARQKRQELTTKRSGLQTSAQEAERQTGQLTERIDAAERAVQEAEGTRTELAVLSRQRRQFQLLADAYALIPVLILEQAIPLLEQEANGILAKISPSGMRVKLETQKALKSREGLAETLEIVVRDIYGERPYEAFSGGERFRLDLALRIGLSKLLANRAGARLETLIIDEGLGSLDEDGLAHLRECLAALGQEWPLVLVVTHVDAMKHTFPSQIMVSKNGNGSTVEIVN